jgi:succinate-semialdehyde dehydrogenase/glutarate-semialdehyde dehydrogenase
VEGIDGEHWVRFEPLGVALGIMPWNYPFGQASRWAVPALMAGNTAILKHASNVTQCALALAEIFDAAGLPPGVFAILRVPSERVGQIVADKRVASVSLTGSDTAGVSVGEIAGRHLKKMVLELGGSDPFLVLDDADVEAAAASAAKLRTQNAGQTCTAAKRFIVNERLAAPFEECLVSEFAKLRLGEPLDRTTDIGPLASPKGVETLEGQVARSIAQGARVAYQAPEVDSPGFYARPSVIINVTSEMPVASEETFGPVAAVLRVPDDAAAVRVANASVFGLGASIWTRDRERALALSTKLQAGMVGINTPVVADPRLPFGGVKRSGFGREMSVHGIRELTNIKTVSIGS